MAEPYRLENWQTGVDAAVHAECVRVLYDLARIAIAAMLAVALLVAFFMWPVVTRGTLVFWLSAMFLCALVVIGMLLRYRQSAPQADQALHWERRFAALAAATGFLWGMAIWLLLPQAGEQPRLFLVLTVCIVSLGGTAVLSPSRLAYHAFMVPMIFPSVFFLLFSQPDSIATAGWSVLIYIAVLVAVHDALYRNLVATFRERFSSEALAAEHDIIFDSATEAIGLIRPHYLAKCNRQWCDLFGYTAEEAIGQAAWSWFPTYEDWRAFAARCMAPIVHGDPYKEILQLRRKSGELFWAEISGRIIDPSNLDLGVVWMGTDITERIHTEQSLKASEQRFRDLLSLWSDWYWEIDSDFRFTRISGQIFDETGISEGQVIGHRRWEMPFIRGVSAEQWQSHRDTLMAHAPFRDFIYQVVKPDGELRWFSISGNPAFDEHGDFAGYHGIGSDITERVEAAELFRHLAHHDTLTGLPNRRLLGDRAEQALALARRSGHLVALLLLDLDDFKIINDTDGHSAGDSVLIAIAQRLRSLVREIDTVSRLGGDEFVVLLQEMSHPGDAVRVAEKVIEAIRQPVVVGGRQYRLGVSVGIAHFPAHAETTEGLMQKADVAMYIAKQAGGATYRVADSSAQAAGTLSAGQPVRR